MSASDDGFETTATLEVELDDRSVNTVKQQLESELGTTEVGVADGGAMSAQVATDGAGGGRERRRRRREYRWARERTDYLEETVSYLEEIEDKVGEGDGGLLSDLLGGGAIGGLLGGAGGVVGGAGGGVATGIGAAVGSAVGSAVGDAISGEKVEVKEPDWTPLEVKKPENALEVDHPEEPYAVDHPENPYAVEDPSPLGVEDPSSLSVNDPSPLDVDDPSPLQVEEVDPLPVEDVDPVEISVDVTTGGSEGVKQPKVGNKPSIETSDGGDDGGIISDFRDELNPTKDGPISGYFDKTDPSKQLDDAGDELNPTEHGPASRYMTDNSPFATDSTGEDASTQRSRPANSNRGPTTTTVKTSVDPRPADIDASVGPIDVNVRDLDRMVDQVVDAVEERVEEVRNDLEDQIDDLKREMSRG
ncbi:hypothetical protein [Natrinema halophilum]|uniref:hypothetical protein n=1 Tax=Natrinema halophilum TaxID=1699371 RepID=UPI001F3B498F|nr:hypothetical protein [Natrinema halophilum]UHQ96463.1 hypothetical protein HYG82_23360 [Natrinema halophilum]